MKKSLLIVIVISLIVFNAGCICRLSDKIFGGASKSSEKDISESAEEILSVEGFLDSMSALDVDFDTGTFSASDPDNDGKDDIFSYSFEKENIDQGLSLKKSIDYKTIGDGLMGSLTLDFENTWEDDTKSYTHMESIPKSFAENVDELEFSVKPDRIVNPDPDVEWVINRMVAEITVESKNEAVSAAMGEIPSRLGWWGTLKLSTKINITALMNTVSSPGTVNQKIDRLNQMIEGAGLTPTEKAALEKAAETGVSAAVITAIAHFDDFKAVNGLAKCNKIGSNMQKHICFMSVIAQYPDSFTVADCDEFDFDETVVSFGGVVSASRGACKSIITGSINDCTRCMIGSKYERFTEEQKQKYCKIQLFNFYATTCRNIRDPTAKKDCLFLSAIQSGSAVVCKSDYVVLDERQRMVCLAVNTHNMSYCQMMEGEEDWRNCCEALYGSNNPSLKEECLKTEDDGQSGDEAAEEFRRLSNSICPTQVPEEAKYQEGSSPGYPEVTELWVMPDGKYVGLYMRWANKEKTKKDFLRCYNTENKEHGVSRYWHKDGVTLSSEYYKKDHKLHGTSKSWYPDGTPEYEKNNVDGKPDGECKGWNKDGTIKYQCTYKEGKCQECVPANYCSKDPC